MTFSYNYYSSVKQEAEEIRKKYEPQAESKFDELKRLDKKAQKAGKLVSLTVGIIGCLLFGVAMCMGLEAIGGGMVFAVIIGVASVFVMIPAYPIYRHFSKKANIELAPKILKLAKEIEEEKVSE